MEANDIQSLKEGEILSSNQNLISVIRERRKSKIVISAIIPRRVVDISTVEKVKHINVKLKQFCRERKVGYLNSYFQTFFFFLKELSIRARIIRCQRRGFAFKSGRNNAFAPVFINSVADLLRRSVVFFSLCRLGRHF